MDNDATHGQARLSGVAARSLKLGTFHSNMTPIELKAIVNTIIPETEYERITIRPPLADEATVVFPTVEKAEAYFKLTRERPLPTYTDETHEIHKLHWNTPDTPADRRRAFLVRKAKIYFPTVLKGETIDSNQRTGRFFVDRAQLVSINVDDSLTATFHWREKTVTALAIDTAAAEAHLHSLLRD